MSRLTPPRHPGMTVLDRQAFQCSFHTVGLRVPAQQISLIRDHLDALLLNQPKLPNIVSDDLSKDTKIVLLSIDKQINDVEQYIPSETKQFILGTVIHEFEVGYDYWTADQIFQAVMPSENTEVPSSFTIVGHIVHLNLKEEHEPYKRLIAEVLLDKNKKVTSVVNKTNNIDNTYRNFQMEVLAGDGNMVASLKENGCRFTFDFSKVYWNSRLQAEHRRIVDMFQKGSTVLDVFAGVGPFALPAVKKGCLVYANDLNPASYHWLNENIRLNKITAGIHTYNMDGREFIRKVMDDVLRTSPGITVDHVVMNLPAIAIEFLDAFRGVYQSFDTTTPLPMIHCHCFTRNTNPEKDIKERLCHAMGSSSDFDVSLHWVRTVAPKKEMYCVSFRLPFEIAFAS